MGVTRYDDLVWMLRRHELLSSENCATDRRPPYPEIDESDMGLYAVRIMTPLDDSRCWSELYRCNG